jgi:hypothetical protein
MAQTGFTPISLYYTTTASATPTAGNLVAGELAINTADGKLFYKDSSGVVQTIASKDNNSGTFTNISVSGVASFADGTVSLPSITNIGYTNTGIYFPAADTIAFTEGGAESMRIDSSGNVLIGTATAQELLTVNKNAAFGTTADAFSELRFFNSTSTAGTTRVRATAGDLAFLTSNAEAMRIDSTGAVLIGTTGQASPPVAGKVNIVGITSFGQYAANSQSAIQYMPDTAGGGIFYQKNAGGIVWGSGANPYSGGTTLMTLNSSGNLVFGVSGSGVQFTNSSAVTNSVLNDYEAGSFSPTIRFGNLNAGQTFVNGPNGRYVKIGKFVYILIGWYFSSKGSSTGNMTIDNLPFTSDNFGFYGSYNPVQLTALNSVPNNIAMIGMNGGSTVANFFQGDCGTALTNTNISDSTYGIVAFSYTANF